MHVLKLDQSMHCIDVGKQQLPQVCDVVHLVLELVAQGVAASDTLQQKAVCD